VPVAGLTTLAIVTNGGDDIAGIIAAPPGVAASLRQHDGDDRATVSVSGTAGATGTILNGGPGDNTLTLNADGQAIAPSNFAVDPDGAAVVSGAPLASPITYSNYQRVFVINPPASPALPI